ncbi:conserved hypothetical protein [Candidatus Roizmanbacteria bacterium]|nr:conserved hypothetical protein [Candidatus Roizmanbacteria bacterium]
MKIIYYPIVEKKIENLDQKDRSRVIKVIDLFEEYNFRLSKEFLKKISKEIWELRAGKYRVLFGLIKDFGIVINLFQKKTQKTPVKEIRLAISRFKQYEK